MFFVQNLFVQMETRLRSSIRCEPLRPANRDCKRMITCHRALVADGIATRTEAPYLYRPAAVWRDSASEYVISFDSPRNIRGDLTKPPPCTHGSGPSRQFRLWCPVVGRTELAGLRIRKFNGKHPGRGGPELKSMRASCINKPSQRIKSRNRPAVDG